MSALLCLCCSRAELALNKGDEELAREALSRRKSYQVGCRPAVVGSRPAVADQGAGLSCLIWAAAATEMAARV